ncbi:MAG: 2-C-methyl-D-erythritol 4-phosphate cytidylyltransferase [Muribaculaceae bacterium]
MTRYIIIVAGGSGSRFGADKPKQFLPLAGKPVLMHTISRFASLSNVNITVVLPKAFVQWWHELCAEYHFTTPHNIVEGGNSRFASVKNAIATLTPSATDIIAVHDGVRPLISQQRIEAILQQAATLGSAVPVIPVTDSIRQYTGNGDESVPLLRDSLRAVQTPQAFNAQALVAAYNTPFNPSYTDDASVIEQNGGTVHLIDGEVTNIKITHPNDLTIAQLLLER